MAVMQDFPRAHDVAVIFLNRSTVALQKFLRVTMVNIAVTMILPCFLLSCHSSDVHIST